MFYHLTYEGAVDLDKIIDPRDKQAVIGILIQMSMSEPYVCVWCKWERIVEETITVPVNYELNWSLTFVWLSFCFSAFIGFLFPSSPSLSSFSSYFFLFHHTYFFCFSSNQRIWTNTKTIIFQAASTKINKGKKEREERETGKSERREGERRERQRENRPAGETCHV